MTKKVASRRENEDKGESGSEESLIASYSLKTIQWKHEICSLFSVSKDF